MKNIIHSGKLLRTLPLGFGKLPSWHALTFLHDGRSRTYIINWRQYSRSETGKQYVFSTHGRRIFRLLETGDAPVSPLDLFYFRLDFVPLSFPEPANSVYSASMFAEVVMEDGFASLLIFAFKDGDEIESDENDMQVELAREFSDALRTVGANEFACIADAAIDRWNKAVENGALIHRRMDMFSDLDAQFRALRPTINEVLCTFIETHSEEIYTGFPEIDIRI